MDKKKEIREILLGNFETEGDILVHKKQNENVMRRVNFPWLSTRIFGIVKVSHRISYDKKRLDRMSSGVYDEMQEWGRLIYLESDPRALSVYVKKWWTEPFIITAERDEVNHILTLTAFTYQGFFSRIILFLELVKMEKKLPYLKERLPKEKKPRKKEKTKKERKSKKRA